MINTDRIVPIMATDLLTMYGTILLIAGKTVDAVQATNPGIFEVTEATNDLIAAEPIATMDFGEDVTEATVYFVPAYNYAGFTLNGVAAEVTGEVEADGCTLYEAVLESNAITVTKVGF